MMNGMAKHEKILVDKEKYEGLLETLEILSKREDVKALKKSIDQLRKGRTVSL